jgi:hypothetical protein
MIYVYFTVKKRDEKGENEYFYLLTIILFTIILKKHLSINFYQFQSTFKLLQWF